MPPPSATHPANRPGFDLESSMQSMSDTDVGAMAPSLQRAQTPTTPRRNFFPEHPSRSNPTVRGYLEGQREQATQRQSESGVEHTPVYKYTPKIGGSATEFSRLAGQETPRRRRIGFSDTPLISGEAAKSPRKGFFGKLGFSSSRAAPSTIPPSSGIERGYGGGEALPPKPKAVLGTTSSSSQSNVPARSPSKKNRIPNFESLKSSFSRKPVPSGPNIGNPFDFSTEVSVKRRDDPADAAPHTATTSASDPINDVRVSGKRTMSLNNQDQSGNNDGKKDASTCGVGRSQSLQYFDRTMPPTPPAKNTPPQDKDKEKDKDKDRALDPQERARQIMKLHMQASEQRTIDAQRKFTPKKELTPSKLVTPKKEMAQLPYSKLSSPIRPKFLDDDNPFGDIAKLMGEADGRSSPTKFGGVAHKNAPTLVKQPSIYSLAGSYYADLKAERSIDEIKKVADDFGLEGLTHLPENYYRREEPEAFYSPSIYSTTGAHESPELRQHTPVFPATFKRSTPSGTPLAIAKEEPSKVKQQPERSTIPCTPSKKRPTRDNSTYNTPERKNRSPGHSRDHSSSPNRDSFTVLCASVMGDIDLSQLSPRNYDEQRPSTKVSPLHVKLPASTYVPPSPTRTAKKRHTTANAGAGAQLSPYQTPDTDKTITPSRSRARIEDFKRTGSPVSRRGNVDVFTNAPSIPPGVQRTCSNTIPDDVLYRPIAEPQKHGHESAVGLGLGASGTMLQQEEEEELESKPTQPAGPDSLDTTLLDQKLNAIETQQEEIARLRAHVEELKQNVRLFLSGPEKSTTTAASPKGSSTEETAQHRARIQALFNRMQTQQDEMTSLREDLQQLLQQNSTTASTTTADGDTNSSDESSPDASPASLPPSTFQPTAQSYAPHGSLTQTGSYHHAAQERVDVGDAALLQQQERRVAGSPIPGAGAGAGANEGASALALDQVINFLDELRSRDGRGGGR